MELTSRQHTIPRQPGPIVNGPRSEIDPNVPLLPGPNTPQTLGVMGRSISAFVRVSVGFRLRIEIKQVDVESGRGAGALEMEILADDVVDDGVRDGVEVGPDEGGGRGVDVGPDGGGDLGGEVGRG